MAVINGTVVGAGEAGFYPYEIDQSLRFEDGSSAYLSRTPASAGNRKTWTFSTWVKRGNLGTEQAIIGTGEAAPSLGYYVFLMRIKADDKLRVVGTNSTGNSLIQFDSNMVFRDVASFYHIVLCVDTTQATNTNGLKVYVNGELITGTFSAYTQNTDLFWNSTQPHYIGRWSSVSPQAYLDGYQAETHFLDGITITDTPTVIRGQTVNFIDEFVELKNGVPIPKAYSGSYGTNGFYLDYSNGASIGADSSGNGNNWTPTNLASTDVMLDSPTNNFATLNPIFASNSLATAVTLAEGNLAKKGGTDQYTVSTQAMSSGKYYCEFYLQGTPGNVYMGLIDSESHTKHTVRHTGDTSIEGNFTTSPTLGSYTNADIVSLAYDADNNKFYIAINGTWQNSANPSAGTGGLTPNTSGGMYFGGRSQDTQDPYFNFGQDSSFAGNKTPQGYTDANGKGDFYYAPPTGYLALCTANLPEPAIGPNSATTADENFNTVLYTGDGASSHAITGVGFQPDFTWVKSRDITYGNYVHDVLRGASARLATSSTEAENTNTTFLQSFDTDGFTTGSYTGHNGNGNSFVAWNWKANGSGVTNTDGTITSTVSANVDAGFSIVSWAGTSVDGTVGHGLTKAPEMVILKNRDDTYNWAVYHKDVGVSNTLFLNTTAASTGSAFWNSTAPTSSVFSVDGGSGTTNVSGNDYIAYAFAEIEGFSKVFSYTGNGSTDGPFQNLGFRPAWLMVKDATTGGVGRDWAIFDNTRNTYNVIDDVLYPNLSNAEATWSGTEGFDFLSNGFKVRTNDSSYNASGNTFIGIAFAENPFKYSNAR